MTQFPFFTLCAVFLLVSIFYFVPRTMVLFNCSKNGFFSSKLKCIYWLFIFVIAFLSLFLEWNDPKAETVLPMIGSLIFAFYLSFLYSLIFIDLVKLIGFVFTRKSQNNILLEVLFPILGFSIFVIGLFMSLSPRLTYYSLDIHKSSSIRKNEKLRIVQISDVNINHNTSLDAINSMVDKVNNLSPDYIVITGNLISLRIQPFVDKGFGQALAKLHARYGKFAVLGNNEFRGRKLSSKSSDKIVQAYRDAGLTVLQNEIFGDKATGIYFVGMDDKLSANHIDMQTVMPIIERDIAKDGYDRAEVPIIILDHSTKDLAVNELSGADLMFSGDTYAGQIFPLNLIQKAQYKNNFGVYENIENHFTSIVSSGFGWIGPMMRLMTRSEIVVIDVDFVGNIPATVEPNF